MSALDEVGNSAFSSAWGFRSGYVEGLIVLTVLPGYVRGYSDLDRGSLSLKMCRCGLSDPVGQDSMDSQTLLHPLVLHGVTRSGLGLASYSRLPT